VIRNVTEIKSLGINEENIIIDASMDKYTSFKAGGKAKALIIVEDKEQLKRLLKFVNEKKWEYILIGNGSNLLFSDEGYDGVVIKLGEGFKKIRISDNTITAGASCLLSQVSYFAMENGLTGFEFASGIPGTLGGGLFMNAGAYGGELKDVVITVNAISHDGKSEYVFSNDDMEFGYRDSMLQRNKMIVTSAVLKLTEGDKLQIKQNISELTEKRNSKQPVTYPSAGSTFKRPVGGYAAQLIDEAGLKGLTVGGAMVSPKHAGFIVNNGNATATDIIELIRLVQNYVYDNSGIMLEPEVRII
jgi:UDP-N-acetylmuramate dehydrogenase